MLFNSLEYLLFLPIVFGIYWLLRKKNLQNAFLLIASYFFYACWDYRFLSLIIISSSVDFIIGNWIERAKSSNRKKGFLFISLLVNLGFLWVFKYYNFFLTEFNVFLDRFGLESTLRGLDVILPVGISFYTFQTLSYSIDIYRGQFKASKNIIQFFAYVSFFPQLVAGPIERASNLLPQFNREREFNLDKAKDGMRQILWGLFKKVAIADNCALFVDSIFGNYQDLSSPILMLGAVLFSIQIYCDFSGYSDIAIGTARLLGFDLMQNFAMPYFARDIAEFWRRWHISLSTWFRDYIYIPLGGSRVGRIKQLRNIFAIFLVSGFWHGANWTFLVWGLLHAMLYIPQVFIGSNRRFLLPIAKNSILPSVEESFRVLSTFLIVTIAWIFFRSDSLTDSILYIERMFSYSNTHKLNLKTLGLDYFILICTGVFIGIMFLFEWFNRDSQHGLQLLPKSNIIRTLIYLALSLIILEFFYGRTSFIYFQF